ncbi:uncharacterized protein LOC143495733 [Brachyhypopomus gauderio]|uniref:uncharacterized protein LOC143495733 n=1 Tax=Brachyhypopomus gauderio TaxID=698409 RepID=UPI004042DDD0
MFACLIWDGDYVMEAAMFNITRSADPEANLFLVAHNRGTSAMDSKTTISQLDSLNDFIHKRLTAIAGEIFQVVTDTLTAFQEEMDRSKQENVYLKKMLTDVGNDAPDTPNKQTDISPPEHQKSSQGPPDSETSVIQVKWELSSAPQDPEAEEQLSTASTLDSVLATRDQAPRHIFSDALGSTAEQQDPVQGPQDTDSLLRQVKLETSSVGETAILQKSFHDTSLCTASFVRTTQSQRCPPSSVKALSVQKKNHSPALHSAVLSEQETWKLSCVHSDIPHSTVMRSGGDGRFLALKKEPDSHLSSKCNQSLIDFSHLKPGLQSRATDRLFFCELCGKPFQNEQVLKTHLVMHQKKRSNHCELCGKSYSTTHALKIHLRTHTGERPYKCRFCNKTFSQKGHLKGHERIHTGEKIYSCSACGKHFTWLSQGKEHLRSHPGQLARVLRKVS